MRRQQWLIFIIAFGMIAVAAGTLSWARANQRLGKPGLKTTPIPGKVQVNIQLPEYVLEFSSTNVPEPQLVIDYLPKDTSYAERLYTAPDGFWIQNTVVLMGGDRTSIHKPDYCLPGQGWVIKNKSVVNITMAGTNSYQMPVAIWTLANMVQRPDGQKQEINGIYAYWLVADGQQTADNYQRMWWMGRDLLRTGVLQRWAYVSYFTAFTPGQEAETIERLKTFIAHSAPQYQLPPAGH